MVITGSVAAAKFLAPPEDHRSPDGMDPAFNFNTSSAWAKDGSEPSRRKAKEGPEMDIKTLGIDLAKKVFHVSRRR
jgi:hypothetical protein